MRVGGTAFLMVALVALGSAAAEPEDEEPVVTYFDAEGSALVGLFGAGVEGVDLATLGFVPNVTHPRLQMLLDYQPTNASAALGPASASLLYEFGLDVRDGRTNETVASFAFMQPGQRYLVLNVTHVDGRTYFIDLYARVGVDMDWSLSVRGWRLPIPI